MLQQKAEAIEEKCICYFCMKAFNNRQSRINHYKSKHQTEYNDIIKTIKDNTNVINGNGTINGDHNTLNIQNTVNTNTTINNNTNYHIHLHPFGEENTEYLTDEMRMKCLECGFPGLQEILKQIYFNEQHPENHNVKLQSIKHEIVLVYSKDQDWEHKPLDDTVDNMIKNSQREIRLVLKEPEIRLLQKMAEIFSPSPSQRSNTKKKVTAHLYQRKKETK